MQPIDTRAATPIDPMRSAMTDFEVIERVLAGELSLYELIMRRHNRLLFRLARGIVSP